MSGQPAVIVNKRGGFFTALVQGFFGFLIVGTICAALLGVYGLWVFDKKSGQVFTVAKDLANNLEDWDEVLPPAVSDALHSVRAPQYRNQLAVTATVVPASLGTPPTDVSADGDAAAAAPFGRVLVEIRNNGDQTLSLLTLLVTVLDAEGVPVEQTVSAAATPLTFDVADGPDRFIWRGPLLPGNTRRYVLLPPCGNRHPRHVFHGHDRARIEYRDAESTDLPHRLGPRGAPSPAGTLPLLVPADATVSIEITDIRLWEPPPARDSAQPTPADVSAEHNATALPHGVPSVRFA